MNPFEAYDRAEAMAAALDYLDVRFTPYKGGWQKVRCPYAAGHAHGDRNPSGSVNLPLGVFTCHACGASGDWARLMYEVAGIKVDEAARLLGLEADETQTEDRTGGGIFLY